MGRNDGPIPPHTEPAEQHTKLTLPAIFNHVCSTFSVDVMLPKGGMIAPYAKVSISSSRKTKRCLLLKQVSDLLRQTPPHTLHSLMSSPLTFHYISALCASFSSSLN